MVGGDFRHSLCARISQDQRTPRLMHTPQPEIPVRAHPQMLLAQMAECPARNTDRCTNLWHIQRLIPICLKHLFEPPHHRLLREAAALCRRSVRQAGDHRANQLLLHPFGNRRDRKNFGSSLGKVTSSLMQPQ